MAKITPIGLCLGGFIMGQFDRAIRLGAIRAQRKKIGAYSPDNVAWKKRKMESVEAAMNARLNPTNYPEFYPTRSEER